MAYVLKRTRDGAYVARPGSEHSYTKKLENARGFDSLADALADKCDNEVAVPLSYIGPFRVACN